MEQGIVPSNKTNDFYIAHKLKAREIECPDSHTVMATPELLDAWTELRKSVSEYNGYDTPIIVNSGFRTWDSHVKLYKRLYRDKDKHWKDAITERSRHLVGQALDMKTPNGLTTSKFEELAKLAGFTYTYIITPDPLYGDIHADVR